jgi:hypothetical protein
MPRGDVVIRYAGKRGVVWRIKFSDSDGKQVMEKVGAERNGILASRPKTSSASASFELSGSFTTRPTLSMSGCSGVESSTHLRANLTRPGIT